MNRDTFIKVRVSADEMSDKKKKADASNLYIRSFLRDLDLALNGKIILYDTENIYYFSHQKAYYRHFFNLDISKIIVILGINTS